MFTKNTYRKRINEDLFKRLLLSSDPVIALGMDKVCQKKIHLTSAMKNLLVDYEDHELSDAEVGQLSESDSSDDGSEEDED